MVWLLLIDLGIKNVSLYSTLVLIYYTYLIKNVSFSIIGNLLYYLKVWISLKFIKFKIRF